MVSESTFFECTQCGDCCNGYGGTYLTEKDMSAIAANLDIPLSTFQDKYCDLSGKQYVLAQNGDGFCIFWDRVCTIHAIKPRMCRQWPFIHGLLRDIGNWKLMASVCPGMKADADEALLIEYVRHSLRKKSPTIK